MGTPFPAQGRGANSPEVLPARGWGLPEVTQRQGGALHPVRQLKLGARVIPAATPPGPTETTAAPAHSLLGRAMGTRDDEYDYLFKGEAVGSHCPRSPHSGLGPSPGTRVLATRALELPCLSRSFGALVPRSPVELLLRSHGGPTSLCLCGARRPS